MGCILSNEAGTTTEKDIDLHPSTFELAPSASPEPKTSSPPNGFSLDVQWRLTVAGKETRLPIDSLIFSPFALQFVQNGIDTNGSFSLEGRLDASGNLRAELVHAVPGCSKIFTGKISESTMLGVWDDAKGDRGTFTVELIGTLYKAEHYWLLVKENVEEPVGMAHFSAGVAVYKTQQVKEKGETNRFILSLKFANGESGTFDGQFYAEGIAGELQTSGNKVKETITLTVKNEFE